MESRRVFGLFTGTHITVMACAALLVPGAVFAVATTAVSVTDSLSGHQAAVDSGRRLYTYDPIAGYANNPNNLINVQQFYNCDGSSNPLYSTPPGQTLILKAVVWTLYNGTEGVPAYAELSSQGVIKTYLTTVHKSETIPVDFKSGMILRSGILSFNCSDSATSGPSAFISLYGYLIPAGAITSSPANSPGSQEGFSAPAPLKSSK